ncbi:MULTISPECIES: DUF2783 domain-containing protein [unclassified Dinoroseobacter]|uniref:DUF2783 domain-containing protein n=1 Tax=unclassified Dinoroseobacter TaxID=2620028 RepID=UPI003C7B514E
MPLTTTPNLPEHDTFYAELLDAHRGLSEAESHALNARLVLILANHVGDLEALRAALALAKT